MWNGLAAVESLERCIVARCEALSSEWAAAASVPMDAIGGGLSNSLDGSYLTVRGTRVSDCRVENPYDDTGAVRASRRASVGGHDACLVCFGEGPHRGAYVRHDVPAGLRDHHGTR